MAKRNDFWAAFLKGMYDSGVGNPEVGRANAAQDLQQQYAQGQLNAEMASKGMIPANTTTPPTPGTPTTTAMPGASPSMAAVQNDPKTLTVDPNVPGGTSASPGTLHQDHPFRQKIASFLTGFVYPGSQSGQTLNTAFKADPTQPTYGMSPTGEVKIFAPGTPLEAGYSKMNPKEGQSALMGQFKKTEPSKPNDAMLVQDKKTKQWRVEPDINYKPTSGEVARPTNLEKGLSLTNTLATGETTRKVNALRGEWMDARGKLSVIQSVNDITKAYDPSVAGGALGKAANSVNRLVNGLDLSSGKVLTQTGLGALNGDLDSVVAQASATEGGRKMIQATNFQNDLNKVHTYFSLHPNDVSVPKDIVSIYKNIMTTLSDPIQQFVQGHINSQDILMHDAAVNAMDGNEQKVNNYKQSVLDLYDVKKRLGMAGVGVGGNLTPAQKSVADALGL